MSGAKVLIVLVAISVMSGGGGGGGGKWVEAQVQHHVVGGDRGWDPSSDLASWASARSFALGDKIWFAYSAAQETIVELKSKEEYESCDVSNPIRMYTEGIDTVSLDAEGIRYFASGKPENCKRGMKLHVEVQPSATKHQTPTVATSSSEERLAAGPATPSASTRLNGLSYGALAGLLLCYMGL